MKLKVTVLAVLASCSFGVATAGEVTGMTTFSSGSKAVASQVNGNFNAVKTAVDNNNSRLGTVEGEVVLLDTQAQADRARLLAQENQSIDMAGRIVDVESRAVMSPPGDGQLTIIRGCVNPNGATTLIWNYTYGIACGTGFYWLKHATGVYEIYFAASFSGGAPAFTSEPAVTASTSYPGGVFATVGAGDGGLGIPDVNHFYVRTYDAVGAGNESVPGDLPFSFIAIGSR
jgi:hypothetical protein